jgi:hypothetical protein
VNRPHKGRDCWAIVRLGIESLPVWCTIVTRTSTRSAQPDRTVCISLQIFARFYINITISHGIQLVSARHWLSKPVHICIAFEIGLRNDAAPEFHKFGYNSKNLCHGSIRAASPFFALQFLSLLSSQTSVTVPTPPSSHPRAALHVQL